ncbi:hypothetical protein DSCA_47750 [Desulfosarcina alkanivorans]|uniref:Uncharacterized protein n=1 Tax=Desulfosarcina alkanivorans TaxID=571177 RepID=A0A5K7YRA7_9BACT|nr:hypothetical protein DSCA_47750 [Desulfosarcina alkanivorans]
MQPFPACSGFRQTARRGNYRAYRDEEKLGSQKTETFGKVTQARQFTIFLTDVKQTQEKNQGQK